MMIALVAGYARAAGSPASEARTRRIEKREAKEDFFIRMYTAANSGRIGGSAIVGIVADCPRTVPAITRDHARRRHFPRSP